MLYDTDILIWVLRGNLKAARLIDEDVSRSLSLVSYMELLQGAAGREEARLIKSLLTECALVTLPLTENIGHRASIYIEEYSLSSGLGLADALIAATAAESRLPLCTSDDRHFRVIRELELSIFRP